MLKVLMPSITQLVTADYASIKTAESEKLINDSLRGLTPVIHPELLQISGIPGAGKSTFCAANMKKNYLFLSFDRIMIALTGYQQELKLNGSVAAFQKYEMPARIIGYELLRRALNKRVNIMFEHSGTNQAHLELFRNIREKGYKTSVDFIICDTVTAIKRAQIRAAETKRYVPEKLILERAAKFKEYVSAYQKETSHIALFDGGNNFRPLNKL
ncbi:MAG: ATP-binding protein [Acetobacter sp.]|nr:ATP-binding protein [Acetobacter sp.]